MLCGFVGAWLLVAGPIYQAALELKDEDIERDHLHEARQKLPPAPRTSAWWWLLPPVRLIIAHRRADAYRKTFMTVLSSEDMEALMSFMNKATGWLYVAGGGLLLATKETYELVEHLRWSYLAFWILVVGLTGVSVANTALRVARSERIVHHSHTNAQ